LAALVVSTDRLDDALWRRIQLGSPQSIDNFRLRVIVSCKIRNRPLLALLDVFIILLSRLLTSLKRTTSKIIKTYVKGQERSFMHFTAYGWNERAKRLVCCNAANIDIHGYV
jgi:hypothetical protein